MRSLLVVLALVGSAASASADAVRDAVNRVPAIATVERGRTKVVVRGDLAQRRAKEMVEVVDDVIADVQRRFTQQSKTADPVLTLCLFSDDASYLAVARVIDDDVPSELGFYRSDLRVAVANLGRSVGNLRHELVHPLVGDDFPAIPAWLNEGLGSLYGTAKPTKRGFEFLVNYRLRDLQRALSRGELPTIAELAESTGADVHGPRAGVYYAMARYVLLYADRRGELTALYRELREATGDVDAQREILTRRVDDRAFRAWARKLRY